MSGHSHWANIQHKKSIEDKKRSALFARLSYEISLAVREAGPNPETNPRLKSAIEKAKKSNLPKEKIQKAINRGAGIGEEGKLEQVLYEVYGPGGSAFLVETLTDNKNRTASELKHLIELNGGSFAQAGSVKWMFEYVGKIEILPPQDISPEDLELKMIDFGAQDLKKDGNKVIIYTDAQKLKEVEKKIVDSNINVVGSEIVWRAKNPINISEESTKQKIIEFEDDLKSYQDVERVFSNIAT